MERHERGSLKTTGVLLLLTYAQSAAGAHGTARLGSVLGDGGDAD